MTTRLLPHEEWTRLDPEKMKLPAIGGAAVDGSVLVVEDDQGVIIGCWSVITCVHVEGAWIDPRYRGKVAVGRRLWNAMKSVVKQRGAMGALMCAVTAESQTRIEKKMHGIEVLGKHFAVTFNG
jgi:hypothetical protein